MVHLGARHRDAAAASSDGRTKRAGWVEALKLKWWPIPVSSLAVAILLLEVVGIIEKHIAPGATGWYIFGGGPPSARRVLAVVASSTLTFAGLLFSVTMVVLQLASSQYSPRVIRTFMHDRLSQWVLGLFAGTFVYALLALRKVRGGREPASVQVPEFTVWCAVVLAITCVLAFVIFIHHIANSIRASVIIRRIGAETRTVLERLYPEGIGSEGSDPTAQRPSEVPNVIAVRTASSGIVQFLDEQRLVRCAEASDLVVGVLVEVGSFVPAGGALLEIWGNAEDGDLDKLLAAVHIGSERTMQQDATFGFRQLVDIALRALSPALNDPTTAVEALHQVHDLLRYVARRRLPDTRREGADGELRLLLHHADWEIYVALSFDDVLRAAHDFTSVLGKLQQIATDVARLVPPHRRNALESRERRIEAALHKAERHLA